MCHAKPRQSPFAMTAILCCYSCEMNLWDKWQTFALGSAVFAALTAIFGKIGVQQLPSTLATFIRTVVILTLIGLVVCFRHEWKAPASLCLHSVLFLILSGIATGLSWLCYYRALQLGPASRVAPVDKLSVVLTMVLAVLFLKEKLSWAVGIGGLLIALGSAVMVLN